ncbi:MAG: RraA family protein, partial [Rhizobium altiplani]
MTMFYQLMDRHPPLNPDLIELLSSVETATIGHVEHVGFVGSQ